MTSLDRGRKGHTKMIVLIDFHHHGEGRENGVQNGMISFVTYSSVPNKRVVQINVLVGRFDRI